MPRHFTMLAERLLRTHRHDQRRTTKMAHLACTQTYVTQFYGNLAYLSVDDIEKFIETGVGELPTCPKCAMLWDKAILAYEKKVSGV